MSNNVTKNPVMVLQEWSVKNGHKTPEFYIEFERTGSHDNRFDYVVRVDIGFEDIEARGSGASKQVSKHLAAHHALKLLQQRGLYDPAQNPVAEFGLSRQIGPSECPTFQQALSCIAILKDLCVERKFPPPIFTEISDVGLAHAKEFTYECKIASIRTEAKSTKKKTAKQLAAKEMLERLQTDFLRDFGGLQEPMMDLEQDTKAVGTYCDIFEEVVPNKSITVDQSPYTLKRLMDERELCFKHFCNDFLKRDEESLKSILQKLDLKYKVSQLQDEPVMMALSLDTDTPFTTIGMAPTVSSATEDALKKAFEIMEVLMQ